MYLMKKIGLIITLLVVAVMVAAITIKLASSTDEPSTQKISEYDATGEAGKLTEGMIGITASNYDENVTNRKGYIAVDYFSPTCSYCNRYTPIFSSVFEQYKDRVAFGKFDVTTDRTKISTLEITGTPTTIIFKDGKEVGRIGGYVDETELKARLDEALK